MSATIFQNSEPGSNQCQRWVIEQRHRSVKAAAILTDRRRPRQALAFDVLEMPGAIVKNNPMLGGLSEVFGGC